MQLSATHLWMIPALPLLAAAIGSLTPRGGRKLAAGAAIAAMIGAFVLSCGALVTALAQPAVHASANFTWFALGNEVVRVGWLLDPLTAFMAVMVTFVGTLIFIFSLGYMQEDRNFTRFFCFLSLFAAAMLGLLVANSLLLLFVCWELVGLASYLLIGFWFHKPAAAAAAKKAFLTTRIGDLGLLLGLLWLYHVRGSLLCYDGGAGVLEQGSLTALAGTTVAGGFALSTAIGLLIFCGAIGKSGQFPLHVWLPDAMEGPTPVSALIHAATMVAAGVYMLCRAYVIFQIPGAWPAPLGFLSGISALDIIAAIGGFTALLAALMAVQQDDIKRILAYSTLSQLGYMVMAVGCGGPAAAMYHLTTHAGFKALLFLGAGAVIHACHHEQNIWRMGGLWRRLPVTFRTFAIGTAALAGLPILTSGFYSKDAILVSALDGGHPVLFGLGVLVAAFTPFYMLRLVIVAFFGPARSDAASHAHEAPAAMTWPLIALAVPSVAVAWLGLGDFLSAHFDPHFHAHEGGGIFGPFNHAPLAAMFGTGALLFGATAAFGVYWGVAKDPLPAQLGCLSRAMRDRFYFDELYEAVFVPLHDMIGRLCGAIDRWVFSGLIIRGVHGSVELFGRGLRLVQTGNLQTYTFLFAAGVAVVVLLATI